jgi:3-phosphoshikimate 1-carboxyvinyltransferase
MATLRIVPAARPLSGSVPCPPDAEVARLAAVAGLLARGVTRLGARGMPPLGIESALEALGAQVQRGDELVIDSPGFEGLRAPDVALSFGSSAHALGALAGLCAALPFPSRLVGDDSLSWRTAGGVAQLLRARGARIEGTLDATRVGRLGPPIVIEGIDEGAPLSELSFELSGDDGAQKAAALFSGLLASGPSELHERTVSDDRAERLLAHLGVELLAAGPLLRLEPLRRPILAPLVDAVPGDSALAAALLVVAAGVADSRVGVRHSALAPSRAGWLEALRAAGATLHSEATEQRLGTTVGDVWLVPGGCGGLRLGGERAQRAGASLPVLAALAARSEGASELFDLPELANHDDTRATLELLTAFGVRCALRDGGLSIDGQGTRSLTACRIDAAGNAEVAMAAACLAVAADGPSEVRGAECIVARFPRFVGSLRALGVDIQVSDAAPNDEPSP